MPARRTQRLPRPSPVPGRARARQPAREPAPPAAGPTLRGFQQAIEATYGARDRVRGLETTFMWLAEEVGELSRALRGRDRANLREEFADVLAWLATLASLAGVDLAEASARYRAGCPRCVAQPCRCRHRSPARTRPVRARPVRASASRPRREARARGRGRARRAR